MGGGRLQLGHLKRLREERGYALRPPPPPPAAAAAGSSGTVMQLASVGVLPGARPRPPSDSDESGGTRNLGRDDPTQNYDWSDDSLDSYDSKQ